MCFSEGMSAALTVATLLAGAYLHRKGTRLAVVQLFYVFGLMEALQWAQWRVADGVGGGTCGSPMNKLLTVLAWTHVAFQPLSMNAYLFSGPGHYSTPVGRGQRSVVLKLCVACGVMMMARLPYGNPLAWLGDRFGRTFPELPRSALAGQQCGINEALCGPRLCTYKAPAGGSGHLAWSVPLLPVSYFLPNASLHYFVFFLPGLVMGRHLVDWLMYPILLITGPLISQYLSATPVAPGAGIAPSYAHEWPSVWCMISVMQVLLAFVREAALTSGPSGQAARLSSRGGAAVGVSGGGKGVAGGGSATPARVISLTATPGTAGTTLRRRA